MTPNRRLNESGRVEAFSDAVFAITITLLVLGIHRPALDEPELGGRLLERWPDYVAFAVSFIYVGVVWLNHHALFARIRNVDLGLNWINLLILATTALLPFPTGVLAGAFSEGASGSREAAVVLYAIVGTLMSATWIPVFPYLARHPDLLLDPNDAAVLAKQKSRPLVGVGSYVLAAVLGYYVSPLLALVLLVWMIAYRAITSEGLHANRLAQALTRTRLFEEVTERRADTETSAPGMNVPEAKPLERVARAGCVAVVGLVVGALTSFGQTYLDGPSNAFVNSASAWLVAPFFVGAWMSTRRGAAAAGLGVCVLQLAGYYVTAHLRGFPASHALIAFWAVCALIGGPIAGLGGRLWRAEAPPLRGLGAAVLASAFLAEGLWVYFHELHYEGTAALWIAIGLGVAVVLGRGPRDWAWLAATVPVALLAEVALSRVYAQSF